MVQRVSIQFIDDLDGVSEAHQSMTFAIDGAHYELDLSNDHVAEMRAALAPFVEVAREVPPG